MKRDEDKVLNIITIASFAIAFSVMLLTMFMPDMHARSAEHQVKKTGISSWSVKSLFTAKKGPVKIILPKETRIEDIKTSTDIHACSVTVEIPGADAAYPNDYQMSGDLKKVDDVRFNYREGEASLEFDFDRVYEPVLTLKDKTLEIDFKKPKDLYDNVILIDASCGGSETGAGSNGIYEKDVTLSVVKMMKEQFDDYTPDNTKVYYTRLSDITLSIDERKDIIDALDPSCFIGIATNSTSSGRTSSMQGAAALYLTTDSSQKGKSLASASLDALLRSLGCQNRGLIPGDEELILKNGVDESAIVKLGYLSNETEKVRLSETDYQKKAAEALYECIVNNVEK